MGWSGRPASFPVTFTAKASPACALCGHRDTRMLCRNGPLVLSTSTACGPSPAGRGRLLPSRKYYHQTLTLVSYLDLNQTERYLIWSKCSWSSCGCVTSVLCSLLQLVVLLLWKVRSWSTRWSPHCPASCCRSNALMPPLPPQAFERKQKKERQKKTLSAPYWLWVFLSCSSKIQKYK